MIENIQARRDAEALLEMAGPDETRERFWEVIYMHARSRLPRAAVEASEPMTRDEACGFAHSVLMPWGEHVGRRVCDVPSAYLGWLVGPHDEFRGTLRRYVMSSYFRDLEAART